MSNDIHKEDMKNIMHGRGNDNTTVDRTDLDLESEILDYVVKSKANFKSQQKDDPELTSDEKRAIALNILQKSHCLFLSKFGHHLKAEHLQYFEKNSDYEISHHLNRLRRYFNNSTRQVDIKNRRYEALKILIEKGEYFSECEMMKRNPLLYEHLVGQYMTDAEIKSRDSSHSKGITFVDILMETVERDRLRDRQKLQQDAENETIEENDSDSESEEDVACVEPIHSREKVVMWGEQNEETDVTENKKGQKQNRHSISTAEKQVLRQEFVTNMYQSFLDGNDPDFDYSAVDNNDAYDNIDLRTQDEEERYFDSESPETVLPQQNGTEESEDELDAYMRLLKEQSPTNAVSADGETE